MIEHVFRYSQIIKTELEKTITQFVEKTSLKEADVVAIQTQAAEVIFKYKIGKIETPEFRKSINKLIEDKGGKSLEDNVFDSCWNSMCVVERKELAELYYMQEAYKFGLHIIGGTNKLQHEFIQKEIQEASRLFPVPEISYTLSFEKGTLDLDLLKESTKNTLSADPAEIIWHVDSQQEPQQTALELLGEFYQESYAV